MHSNLNTSIVQAALNKAKQGMRYVLGFSFVVNLLLLTSPLFMLQVYDRVLLSRSEETLLGLLLVAAFALLLLSIIETIRSWMLNRIAVQFDKDLGQATFSERLSRTSPSNPLYNLNNVRSFINAPFILALFDMPWMPLYLGLVYMLHPMLGHIGLVGAIILFILALVNDRITRTSSEKANQSFGAASKFVEHSSRNKDAVLGLGMLPELTRIWSSHQQAGLSYQTSASDRNTLVGAIAKTFRQMIQVAVLGMGAYLTIQDLSTAGVMIAASIIIARALAPIEQSIQGWRGLSKAQQSYRSLEEFMPRYKPLEQATQLPEPKGHISLQNVVAFSPDNDQERKTIIKNISLSVQPGEMIGVTGPSGSGKSSLAKLITGVLQPVNGTVRIDNAQMSPETRAQYAKYIGYLPQEVELFDGTISENISRFKQSESESIIEAAKKANAHDLILSLPNGYETIVGPSGENLSGGQRQRIGLARALFGNPKIVILDEPTSNLDNEGRIALSTAINRLRSSHTSLILIAHQYELFMPMDKVAVIRSGQLETFGPTKEVLDALKPKSVRKPPLAKSQTQLPNKPVVRSE